MTTHPDPSFPITELRPLEPLRTDSRVRLLRLALATVAATVLLAVPTGAGAAVVDLSGAPGSVRVDGQAVNDLSGVTVASAGDVNGDGMPDFVVGAWDADNNARLDSGSAYVVYGGQNLGNVNLQNLGSAGFRIDGAAPGDEAGASVAAAGDVNGDGLADVIVGARESSNNARGNSGSAYVIYGRRTADPIDVDLANITTTQASRGFRIDGAAANDLAGFSVAGAGDLNGDGLSDVIVGATGAGNAMRLGAGSAYVIYGQQTADPADVDLANITSTQASRGFRIDGAAANDGAGNAVAGAGDLNGDGMDDVIVGASGAANNGRANSGSGYVIYGQRTADPSDVDLANITTTQGSRGFRIDGAAANDGVAYSVAGAGDLNGDGLADAIIGAPVSTNGRVNSGSAYVIYGQQAADPADVDLANIATSQASRGLRIDGAAANDLAGISVAGAGDLNGDGIADAILGAPAAGNNGRSRSGSAYVIYGQKAADPADVDLANIATTQASRGLRIDGEGTSDLAGYSVAGGADLNGDGHPDAIVGAPAASGNDSRPAAGSTYVLDLAAPETAIDAAPTLTNDPTPTFTFHATEPASFQCSIDTGRASFTPCSGPGGSHTPTRGLADGRYTFRVAAVDRAGNADPTPATKQFTVNTAIVDTTAPQTKITKHPKKTLTLAPHKMTASVTFAFTSSEARSTFLCKLDKRPFTRCISPTTYRLKKGTHNFAVAARDAAGNTDTSAAKFNFEVNAPRKHPRHRPRHTH
jgi:hypothetical protein